MVAVTKPKCRVKLLNQANCGILDNRWYADGAEKENVATDYFLGYGFQSIDDWVTSNATIRSDGGSATIVATAANGYASIDLQTQKVQNPGFETGNLSDWTAYDEGQGENKGPTVYDEGWANHSGTYGCELSTHFDEQKADYGWIKQTFGVNTFKPTLTPAPTFWQKSFGTLIANYWGVKITLHYSDGTEYNETFNPCADWTQRTLTSASVKETKLLQWIKLETWDAEGTEDQRKPHDMLVDDVAFYPKSTISTHDAPYATLEVIEGSLAGNCVFAVQDNSSTWHTVATLTSSDIPGTLKYNLHDDVYDGTIKALKFTFSNSGDWLRLNYVMIRQLVDWVWDAGVSSETGGWLSTDFDTLSIYCKDNGDGIAIARTVALSRTETPYLSFRYKAGTDIDLKVDAYVDGGWVNDLFADTRANHTDDWEFHQYTFTSGTNITKLRIRAKAQGAGADAQLDFIAVHGTANDCRIFDDEYIRDLSIDQRDDRAEAFTINVANPNGIFKNAFQEGSVISIELGYEGQTFSKVCEGFVLSRKQRITASEETVEVSGESRGTFIRYNNITVSYYETDYGTIVEEILNNYGVDVNGRRRAIPSVQFAHKTFQYGTIYYEETGVLEILEDIAEKIGYEFYIDETSRVHFFFTEDPPYLRPEEYTENNLYNGGSGIWKPSVGTLSDETGTGNVYLGAHSAKLLNTRVGAPYDAYCWVVGKHELCGTLNRITFFAKVTEVPASVKIELWDTLDTKISESSTYNFIQANTWELVSLQVTSGDSAQLLKQLKVYALFNTTNQSIYIDAMFAGGVLPRERKFPFPYDGDRFTEGNAVDWWSTGGATGIDSQLAKVGKLSVKGVDTSTHIAQLGYFDSPNFGVFRVYAPTIYNYVSFWFKGKVYGATSPQTLLVRIRTKGDASCEAWKNITVAGSWNDWHYGELKLGDGLGWAEESGFDWTQISGILFAPTDGSETPVAKLDELYIDGLRFFYDGSPTAAITLGSNIISVDVSKDVNQIVNRFTVTYENDAELTVEDLQSQELYELREKSVRKPLYTEAQATAFAYSTILSQAFPRDTVKILSVGTNDYGVGQFISFNIDRFDFYKRGVISRIKHTFSASGWTTEIGVGSPQYERVIRYLNDEINDLKRAVALGAITPSWSQVLAVGDSSGAFSPVITSGETVNFTDDTTQIYLSGSDLCFKDPTTGTKTLAQLAAGGGTQTLAQTLAYGNLSGNYSIKMVYGYKLYGYTGSETGTPTYTIDAETGTFTSADGDLPSIFGRTKLSTNDATDAATVMHRDMTESTSYALKQSNAGATSVNSATGQTLGFNINNALRFSIADTVLISYRDVKVYSGYDFILYSDAGSTAKFSVDGATGNVTTAGNITITTGTLSAAGTVSGSVIQTTGDGLWDSGANQVISFNGTGGVDQIGDDTPATGEALTWDGSKAVWSSVLINPTTANVSWHSGADAIFYSDVGFTEKARIDGATGNITTVGTVDGVDVSLCPTGSGAQHSITKWTGTNAIGAATNFTQDATNNYIYMASGSGSYYSLYVGGGGEVTLTANTGYAIFGAPASYHVAISQQHIQAKSSGTTATTLAIQPRGGTTQLGFYTASNLELYNAGDVIVYSDGGTTEKARIDGATGNITTVGTVDGIDVSSLTNLVKTTQANTYTAGMKQMFQASATTAGLNFAGLSGDPSSPATGDVWYDSASDTLQFRYSALSGTVVDLTKSQTLTTKTINATDNTITDTSTAAGDLLVSNGTKFLRLAKGTTGYVLKSTDGGLEWGAQSGGETLNQTLALGNTATGYNVLMENGYDVIWYSDAGSTVKAAIYGDTGRGSFGRAIGSVGIPTLEVYGTASGTSCASIQEVISTDNYPTYQLMSYAHDNVIQMFDCYYDGSYRSSDAGSNYQIYKYNDILSIRGATGVSAGTAIASWVAMWDMTTSASICYKDLKTYSGADYIVYSDAGSTEVARIDGATGNITTSGTIQVGGNDIKDSGGNIVVSFNGTGGVDKIGGDTPASGEALTWDGSKAVWSGIVTNPTTVDISWHSGVDAIFYSDAGTTEKARIDGATGNFTTSGWAQISGNTIRDSSGVTAIAFDGSAGVSKIGSDSPATNEGLIWDGAKAVWGNPTPASHSSTSHTGNIFPGANQTVGAYYTDIAQIAAPANPSAGTRRLFVNTSTGKLSVQTSGGSTVSLEETGGGSQTLEQTLAIGNTTGNYDIKSYSGYDLIGYSDAGTTEKWRIDSATGNITTSGTVDGTDISAHAHTGSDGTARIAPAAISAEDAHSSDATARSTTATSWTEDANLSCSISCAVGDVVLVISSGMFYGASSAATYYYRLKVSSGTATVLARTDYFLTNFDSADIRPSTLFLAYRCTSAGSIVIRYEYYTSSASYAATMYNRQIYGFKVGYTAS